jgi:hypothetical protein
MRIGASDDYVIRRRKRQPIVTHHTKLAGQASVEVGIGFAGDEPASRT